MNLLKYTNGVGHLIMSVVSMITGLLLILLTTGSMTRGLGTGLIITVQGYWFVSGAAKQTATEIVNQLQGNTNANIQQKAASQETASAN